MMMKIIIIIIIIILILEIIMIIIIITIMIVIMIIDSLKPIQIIYQNILNKYELYVLLPISLKTK